MAAITRTKTFSTPTINREDIANLLEDALLSNLGLSDLAADVILVTAASEAPAATPGKHWFDMTDQLWKVYDSAHSLWLAYGPDRKDVAMQNWSGGAQALGTPVVTVVDADNPFRTSHRDDGGDGDITRNWHGIAQDSAASGAWYPCAIMGFMWGWLEATPNGGFVPQTGYVHMGPSGDFDRVGYNAPGNPTSRAFGRAAQRAGPNEKFLLWWMGPKQRSNTE
jgi:hypothetical protein